MSQAEEASDGQTNKSTPWIALAVLALLVVVVLGYWLAKKNKNILSLNNQLQRAEAAQTEFGDKDIRIKFSVSEGWGVNSDTYPLDLVVPVNLENKGNLKHSEIFISMPYTSACPKPEKISQSEWDSEQGKKLLIMRIFGTSFEPYIGAGLSSSSSTKEVAKFFHFGEVNSQKADEMKFLADEKVSEVKIGGKTALKEEGSDTYYLFDQPYYYEILTENYGTIQSATKSADPDATCYFSSDLEKKVSEAINNVLQSIKFEDVEIPK